MILEYSQPPHYPGLICCASLQRKCIKNTKALCSTGSNVYEVAKLLCSLLRRTGTSGWQYFDQISTENVESNPPAAPAPAMSGFPIPPTTSWWEHLMPAFLTAPDSWATCHLSTTNYQLPPVNCQLPPATCQLPPANCQKKMFRQIFYPPEF